MTLASLAAFREIWLVDFEFRPANGHEGNTVEVVCLVARELRSGKTVRLRRDQLAALPPYATDEGVLFVAYYASAEIGCHLALDWPVPQRVLDLWTEHRNATNGLRVKASLLEALMYYGLDHMGSHEKQCMRDLILNGGAYSEEQWLKILEYCEADVEALGQLLPVMLPTIDLPRALYRGRYMTATAHIERTGVPIDVETADLIEATKRSIADDLVMQIDQEYGVYDGGRFVAKQFAEYLALHEIPWPQTDTGRLKLDDDTFRQMERTHPQIRNLAQLRSFKTSLTGKRLPVGEDGRNRAMVRPFSSVTGRNQPSSSEAIFHRSAWARSYIKPTTGTGLAYLDYCQQEVGIAAALSGDEHLKEAYLSGDPYLEFGKQAGAIPQNGTKHSHKAERDRFKACVLAVQYGMQAESLARKIGCPVIEAIELLRLHRETYPVFWSWSQANVDDGMMVGSLQTVFGWRIHVSADQNPRTLANFPMQANGAEILRLACCMATESGLKICAPVHDALLLEAPLERLDDHIAQLKEIMAEASRIVLDGFSLRTDLEVVLAPARYSDPRGAVFWDEILALAREARPADLPASGTHMAETVSHP